MHEIDFVALDCETTGLDSTKDNIIELGAVKFSLPENIDSFDSLFYSPTRIPQFVERLTGIKNSDLEGASKFEDKREEIEKFCEGTILVGHNIQFDLDFLTVAGVDLREQLRLDTFHLAGLVLPRGDSLSLENLSAKFNIVHEDAHRALADAEATRDLLRVFVSLAKNFSKEKWERVLDLKSTTKGNWVGKFTELVLGSETQGLELAEPQKEVLERREKVVKNLSDKFAQIGTPSLLEASASAAEVFTAAESLEKPVAVFFGSNFEARRVSDEAVFSSQVQVDPEKLEGFLAKNLSASELPLAAKLILHEGINLHELNLTRAENLLFDFVAAEDFSENKEAQVLVSDHASLPEFQNSERLKVIADSITLSENLVRAKSFIIDLKTLEELVPQHAEKIQIWWGLLGLLFREAAPSFGRLNLAEATGLANFLQAIEVGKNFLEVARADLPPRVVTALENLLESASTFKYSLRSSAMNEITLVIEPVAVLLPESSNTIFLDAAADAGDNFAFAKRLLQLPENASISKIENIGDLPHLSVADDLPNPATPQFFLAVEKYLLKTLPELEGITVVVFPNRMEAGKFAERAIAELDVPVFFRRIPAPQKLAELKKAVVVFTNGSKILFPEICNFVSVKLPFIVSDGADWGLETLPATVLRFKKMWENFASLDSAQKFIALDPRLLGKAYGKNFFSAISQKAESFSAEC